MSAEGSRLVRFGGYELDPETAELWRDGEPVDLPPKPARLLALLARAPGRIVSRKRIQDEIWGDAVVEFDQAINNAVRQVRDALGDDASDPRFIETVPRRGYRFVAPVEPVGRAGASKPPKGADVPSGTPPRGAVATAGRRRRWSPARFGAGAAIAVGIAAASWVALDDAPPERDTVVAVVPARASTAASRAEALADSLTHLLIGGLEAFDPGALRVVPWTWDMSLDPETGVVARSGAVLDIDLVVDLNVYAADDDLHEVTVSITSLPGRHQVWYRRFEDLPREHGPAAATVVDGVTEAVRQNLVEGEP